MSTLLQRDGLTLGLVVTAHDVATRYVGTREVEGLRDSPAIMDMLRRDAQWPEHDETPWCSAFANHVAWLLGLPRSKSLVARSWLEVGEPVESPRRGFDVVVMWRGSRESRAGHVGFFHKFDESRVHVLGGNQSDSVNVSSYPLSRVLGYRRLA